MNLQKQNDPITHTKRGNKDLIKEQNNKIEINLSPSFSWDLFVKYLQHNQRGIQNRSTSIIFKQKCILSPKTSAIRWRKSLWTPRWSACSIDKIYVIHCSLKKLKFYGRKYGNIFLTISYSSAGLGNDFTHNQCYLSLSGEFTSLINYHQFNNHSETMWYLIQIFF